MQRVTDVYITDKTGKKFFNTLCSTDYVQPEIRNMHRHLMNAENNPQAYSFLDLETATIVTNYRTIG